jgi:hypothetical protein
MNRISQLICSSLLVIGMTSCANKPAPVEKSTTTAETSVASTPKGSTDRGSGFNALQGVVSSTKTAVESGKLDVAKTEFAKFEASWKTVEDGVKSKAPDSYKAIEDGVQSVETGIGSKQSKVALLASLQKLSQSIDQASK